MQLLFKIVIERLDFIIFLLKVLLALFARASQSDIFLSGNDVLVQAIPALTLLGNLLPQILFRVVARTFYFAELIASRPMS